KSHPLGVLLLMSATVQLSVALTAKVTLPSHTPRSSYPVRFAGQVIAGGCVSFTVTVKVHVEVLPCASVAVLVTVVAPTAKAKPLAGPLVTVATVQLSVALTAKVTLLAHVPGAVFTVRFAGQVIAGGCVSFTVTVKVHVLALPLLSRAVLVTVVAPTGNANP